MSQSPQSSHARGSSAASASAEGSSAGWPAAGTPRVGTLDSFLLTLPGFRSQVYGTTRGGALLGHVAAVAMSLIATAARFALDPMLPAGFPYLTFFPAVILTGFVWGIFPAITAGVLSGLAAWYWFIPPKDSFGLDAQAATALLFYLVVITVDLGLLQLALRALGSQVRAQQALERALATQQVVSDEVDHRLKNLLATVSGLIALSQKHVVTSAELGTQLQQRIHAMSRSVALLRGAGQAEGATLRGAVLTALHPLGIADSPRLAMAGPDLLLSAQGMIPLNLVIHELGTNAIKHGAFANDTGTVSIVWELLGGAPGRPTVRITWQERGGPATEPPSHSGFGTELMNRMSRAMAGSCTLDFAPEGLVATLTLDRERVIADASRPGTT